MCKDDEDPGLKIWGLSDEEEQNLASNSSSAANASTGVRTEVYLAKTPHNGDRSGTAYDGGQWCSSNPVAGACFESTLIEKRSRGDATSPAEPGDGGDAPLDSVFVHIFEPYGETIKHRRSQRKITRVERLALSVRGYLLVVGIHLADWRR